MAATIAGSRRRLKLIGSVFLLIFVIWTLIPFYWMLVTSLKGHDEIYGTTATLWPQQPTLENYRVLFFETDYFLFFRNSMTVALATTLMTVLAASLAAYAIARLKFPGRSLLARGMIYSYLVPQSLLFIPLVRDHGQRRPDQHADRAHDRPHGLHHPVLHLAPDRLLHVDPDRARGGGAGRWLHAARRPVPDRAADLAAGARGRGVLLVHPVLERVLYAIVFNSDPHVLTIPIGLSNFVIQDVFFWGPIMASTALTVIPPLAVYFFFQRWLITGLTMGAVKA